MLASALAWKEAHVTFDDVVEGFPADLRGIRPEGLPHSGWELVEHLRITQRDILDFCRDAAYQEKRWPDDYWPGQPAPPSDNAWDAAIAAYRADRQAMQELARDPDVDLNARIPHGSGQTYLREVLLVLDHGAYHVGQLLLVRRALGAWGR